MVPREFSGILRAALCPGDPGEVEDAGKTPAPLSGNFLRDFFERCDTLRFGGGEIARRDAEGLLEGAREFLVALARAERQGRRSPEAVAAGGRL
jgi:hypothetical protein